MTTEFYTHENLQELALKVFTQNKAMGWWPEEDTKTRCPFEIMALIQSEASEALEGLRKNLMDDHLPEYKMVEVELADVLIRLLDFVGAYGINIGTINKAFLEKKEEETKNNIFYTGCNPVRLLSLLNCRIAKLTETYMFDSMIKVLAKDDENFDFERYASEQEEKRSNIVAIIIQTIEMMERNFDYKVQESLFKKLDYNKKRADHKLENRMKDGGKKF